MNAREKQIAINKYNNDKLYNLGRGRPAISKALTKPLRQTLRQILLFAMEHEPQILLYGFGLAVYTIPTPLLSRIRGKKSEGVSNRHLNYLCAMGLLVKVPQSTETDIVSMQLLTDANREFMKQKVPEDANMLHPMNTIRIPKWTPTRLDAIEERTRLLLDNGITAGNISCERLCTSGLYDIACNIYCDNRRNYKRNRYNFNIIRQFISDSIDDKGYCTKAEIYNGLKLREKQIDQALSMYKLVWQHEFNYGPPKKKHKQQYGITGNKWIYTKTKGNISK